jgi:predicted metal-binding membrane protein
MPEEGGAVTRTSGLEAVLKRDRVLVAAGLAAVFLVSLTYTFAGIGMNMSALTMTRMAIEMPGMMMQPMAWSPAYAVLVFLMWWVMMIAMMVPSAAPMVLLHAAVARKQENPVRPLAATALFALGYLAVWAGFSLIATLLQWGLERIGVLTGMMELASPVAAGAVLVVAGLYQFTPLKQACLRHCQSPITFIAHHWRSGAGGAWRMGLEHGAFCLGCCWFLMALLFVGGIMNLLWIGAIALYVGIEKFAAGRRWVTIATGAALTVAGLSMLAAPFFTV